MNSTVASRPPQRTLLLQATQAARPRTGTVSFGVAATAQCRHKTTVPVRRHDYEAAKRRCRAMLNKLGLLGHGVEVVIVLYFFLWREQGKPREGRLFADIGHLGLEISKTVRCSE